MPAPDSSERRVSALVLRELVVQIFESCRMSPIDADALASTLVESDLRGVHSHGVLRVPEYVYKLTEGGVDPRGEPSVVRDVGACLVVDGGNSMGQIGAAFAMRHAIERAETTGVAAAAVRGSNHCGAMAWYAMMALEHEMIGLATTNCLPTMAPYGGADRIMGINPLAVAIPAGDEEPIVYDGAFSPSAHMKFKVYQRKGLELPEGWATDRDGLPTTDPAVALEGLMLPIGGFKGTGLALIMGVLSSMLSGADYGTELASLETGPRPGGDGHFLAAIRIGAFEEPAVFRSRVDKAIREIHACRPAPGHSPPQVPGEPERRCREARLRDGIPLDDMTLESVLATALRLGLPVPSV